MGKLKSNLIKILNPIKIIYIKKKKNKKKKLEISVNFVNTLQDNRPARNQS